MLNDEEVLGIVRDLETRASGNEFAADELVSSRTNALKYYMGKPRGDEVEGRSAVISMDIADTTHAMLAEILPVFSGDNIANFEATSEMDEEQARVESAFCNFVVMEQNNGEILIETLIKDALLSKTCYAKVYVDESEDTETEKYEGASEMEMLMALTPQGDEEIDVMEMDEERGYLKLKRTKYKRKLMVEPVAPENFAITSEHRSIFLEDCTYCREKQYLTKSDLIEMGYSKKQVEDLPVSTSETQVDAVERNQIQDEQFFQARHPSMQTCRVHTHYVRLDRNEDGIAELLKVVTVENHILEVSDCKCIPYAAGTAFLMGHRHYGLSLYDLLRDVQDMKTHFLRQWSDNALVNNHNKEDVVAENVNMDDFTNGRPNAIRRVKDLNSNRTVPTNDIGPSCQMALDYYDKVRAERAGSSVDLQTNEIKTPSNVGDQGVATIISNLEQITSLVTKTLSETIISSMFKLVHKKLKEDYNGELKGKISGNWQNTNPSQWMDRDQVNINVGLTKSERVVQQVALEKLILQTQQLMGTQGEGVMADKGTLYNLYLDHARMSGISRPEKYLINPSSPQSQQTQQMLAQQAQMQQQMMMEQQSQLQQQLIQTQIMDIQRQWEEFTQEMNFKYEELYRKLAMDKYETDVRAEADEAKIVGDATTKLELESLRERPAEVAN